MIEIFSRRFLGLVKRADELEVIRRFRRLFMHLILEHASGVNVPDVVRV